MLFISLLAVFFFGCKRHTDQPSGNIEGVWELRETEGSAGVLSFPAGNGHFLNFIGNHYEIHDSGQITKFGQFIFVRDYTVSTSVCLVFPTGRFINRIIYDNDSTATKIFFEVVGDKLTFQSGCYAYDAGHSETYARIVRNGP